MRALTKDEVVTACRFCYANCGIGVKLEDGRPVSIIGDPEHPASLGFTCMKGRALPDQHNDPDRLLSSVVRGEDGFKPIEASKAIDEIADRLRAIVEESGPRSVAFFWGDGCLHNPSSVTLGIAFMEALGSPMVFDVGTIDQPSKTIAPELLGRWEGGPQHFFDSDVWMMIGTNPLVSMYGAPTPNPAHWIREAKDRGMKLIVIDPRRTEVARQADIYLQPHPGEDPTLLAGMLRVILDEGLIDQEFIDEDVEGVDVLRRAVDPFTLAYVAGRTGVAEADIELAARTFARAKRGMPFSGTGPSMAPKGLLTDYLILCLSTVCGRWRRAGEPMPHAPVLRPAETLRAQAKPRQSVFRETKMRVRNLSESVIGMPTPALAEEILTPGEGRVRAFIVLGGNPITAIPDQPRMVAAFDALDLSVSIDIKMTATARRCDYVIAPKMSLETEGIPWVVDFMGDLLPTYASFVQPWSQYAQAVATPPAGSDLIEDWEFFYGLGQRLGLELKIEGEAVDMDVKPSTRDLHEMICRGSRIPLDEVINATHGGLWPADTVVQPKEDGWEHKLDVANPMMMSDLAEVAAQPMTGDRVPGDAYPYRLISRRMKNVFNSIGMDLPRLNRPFSYNPAFMHPEDMERDGIEDGALVEIRSRYGALKGIVEPDPDVKPGAISMAHCWGAPPGEGLSVEDVGSSTGALIDTTVEFDPISGMPRMSAIPVSVGPLSRDH